MTYVLPILMICLSVGASIVYLVSGDYLKATYWFAAALINLTVILM